MTGTGLAASSRRWFAKGPRSSAASTVGRFTITHGILAGGEQPIGKKERVTLFNLIPWTGTRFCVRVNAWRDLFWDTGKSWVSSIESTASNSLWTSAARGTGPAVKQRQGHPRANSNAAGRGVQRHDSRCFQSSRRQASHGQLRTAHQLPSMRGPVSVKLFLSFFLSSSLFLLFPNCSH